MAKENSGLCLLFLAVFTVGVLFSGTSSFPMPETMGQPTSEAALKQSPLLANYDPRDIGKLLLLSYLRQQSLQNERVKAKRTCLLNAGLSHSCDYKDVLAAIDEGMYLGSENTPGKK